MDYLKIIIYKSIRLFFRIFCFFPIKDNRIMFESYKGRSYSCNPKYICEYLHNDNKWDMIWIINSSKRVSLPENMKSVKKRSLLNLYYHMTSKFIITNMTDDVYIPKREKQVVINTWHAGGAYKRIGLSYEKAHSKLASWQAKVVCKEISYFISSSELFTKYNINEAYHYYGKILKSGMPRNDLFFDDAKMREICKIVKRRLNICDKKVILYAPTFRGDYGKAKEAECSLPIEEILNAFDRRKEDVVILNRSHYALNHQNSFCNSSVIDVSDYDDMQELLAVSDILITDYSSSIWDYSLTKRPCILYVPDREEYLKERGTYTPLEKWPGVITSNEKELIDALLNIDDDLYKKKAIEALDYYHSYENGNACQIIYRIIEEEYDSESVQ